VHLIGGVILLVWFFSGEGGTDVTAGGVWWWNRNEFRQEFKKDHPDVKGVAAVGKAGGERWKAMSEAVRPRSIFLALVCVWNVGRE